MSADFSTVSSVGKRILPDNDRDNTLVAIAHGGGEIPADAYPILEWR